jgi:hypothetical protein
MGSVGWSSETRGLGQLDTALTAAELRGACREVDSPRYDVGKPVSSWMRARFGAATLSGE